MSDSPVTNVVSESRLVGRVKWFNNKSGFGFITLCDDTDKEKDIFVHYTCLRAENSPYKYLVQGEYVEFNLTKSDDDNHEYHATDVTGIKEGLLMCQTHCLNNTLVRSYVPRPRRVHDEDRVGPPRERRQPVRNDQSVSVTDPTPTEGYTEVKRKSAPRKKPTATR